MLLIAGSVYCRFITTQMRGAMKLPVKNIIKQLYPKQITESNVKQLSSHRFFDNFDIV